MADTGLNRVILNALITSGYTPNLNIGLLEWAQANGAASGNLNIAMMEALDTQGATVSNFNGKWMEVLGGLGYTGNLNERMYEFWLAGGTFSGIPANALLETTTLSGLVETTTGTYLTET